MDVECENVDLFILEYLMCFHVDIKFEKIELKNNLGLPTSFSQDSNFPHGQVNGFSKPLLPIVANNGSSSNGNSSNEIILARWGLIPSWVKDKESAKKISSMTLNARSETVAEKPSFRESWKNNQRCLIPVSGFYEWKHVQKKKIKHLITYQEPIFTLAGIWSIWNSLLTFSILTTQASGIMKEIHNTKERMPFVIPQDCRETWINDGVFENTDNLRAEVIS